MHNSRNTHFTLAFALLLCTLAAGITNAQNSADLPGFLQSYTLTADDGTDATDSTDLASLLTGGTTGFPFAFAEDFTLNSNVATGGATPIDPAAITVTSRLNEGVFDLQFDTNSMVTGGQSLEFEISYTVTSQLSLNVARLSLLGHGAIGDGTIEVIQFVEDDIGSFTLSSTAASPVNETFLSAADTAEVITSVTLTAPGGSGISACDFDSDGQCDIADLDLLYVNFGDATEFDVNADGVVDANDIRDWHIAASSPDNPYLGGTATFRVGDVDLNGEINSTDLGQLLNSFGNASGLPYGNGNLNNDANVDSQDLGSLLNNFGFGTASFAAVPEPESFPISWFALIVILLRYNYRRSR